MFADKVKLRLLLALAITFTISYVFDLAITEFSLEYYFDIGEQTLSIVEWPSTFIACLIGALISKRFYGSTITFCYVSIYICTIDLLVRVYENVPDNPSHFDIFTSIYYSIIIQLVIIFFAVYTARFTKERYRKRSI